MREQSILLYIFSGRLARRISATFIACALIPVLLLALLSLYQVSHRLEDQASPPRESSLSSMRQIADHLVVAWSNVNLIQELRRLTMGSMQALARAVDAKSSWIAGHSARVMRIALSRKPAASSIPRWWMRSWK